MYTQNETGEHRSISRNVVTTALSCKSSDCTLILNIVAFRGEVTLSIVGSLTCNYT